MRLTSYLWIGMGAPPPEYIDFILCRDVFHCRPSELREEALEDVLDALTCLTTEYQVAQVKRHPKMPAAGAMVEETVTRAAAE